jgi:hypothetical protein
LTRTAARWPNEGAEDVVLVVNEAVPNAVEHAHAMIAASPALHPTVDVHWWTRCTSAPCSAAVPASP